MGFIKDMRKLMKNSKELRPSMEDAADRLEDTTEAIKEANRANELRESGRKVKAEVLAMRDTQHLVNFDPVVEFDLRIHPEDDDLYHVSGHRQLISKVVMPQIAIGGTYDAFVDNEDKNHLIVNF